MAKPLRIVAPGQKPVTGVIKGAKLDGVKSSKTSDLSLGDDPGVDYDPKAKAERDFVAKHKVEKHADRVGNKEEPYSGNPEHYVLNSKKEKRHGNMLGAAQKVYEAKGMKCESCGNMYEGTSCGCSGKSVPEAKPGKRGMIADKKKLQEVLKNSIKEDAALKGYGPTDRGTADGYYGRKPDPHKFVAGQDGNRQRVKLTDPNEIKQYMAAHKDDSAGSKVYESAIATKKKKKSVKETTGPDSPMNVTYGDGVAQGRV